METKDNKRVIIIGGGPAGLTSAYELCKAGIPSVVLEKDGVVGGISRTAAYKGYHFDIGGHRFFTKSERVDEIWRHIIGKDFLRRKRLSRIYYNKKLYFYPLRAGNALRGLGLWNSLIILMSYFYAQVFPKKPEETFETWVLNRFGKHLYNVFFKNYTEKVWGVPCAEISAEWAAHRIKGLSLITALRNALIRQKGGDQKVITTLIKEFDYPTKGPGMMWETMADLVRKKGAKVALGAEVKRIFWKNSKITGVEINKNGVPKIVEGTHFISSMPLRDLIESFVPKVSDSVLKAAKSLNYRDFLTIVLIVDKPDIFPDNWIYIHDPAVKVGRLQNYKNWSPCMVPDKNKTCLGLEYFCFEGDELWGMSDEDLIELGKTEMEALGFAVSAEIVDGTVVRMQKTYPMYESGYKKTIRTIRDFLQPIDNLQLVGRNGMHRYNNMDHSMLTAIMAVENIQGGDHNLWTVNADQDYHETVVEPADIEEGNAQKAVLRRTFARIDKLSLATAVGTVSGLMVLAATIFLLWTGAREAGAAFRLLSQYYVGYTVSFNGALIGMGYGFFWGFIFTWLFAYLRNLAVAFFIFRAKRKLELLTFRDFLDNF